MTMQLSEQLAARFGAGLHPAGKALALGLVKRRQVRAAQMHPGDEPQQHGAPEQAAEHKHNEKAEGQHAMAPLSVDARRARRAPRAECGQLTRAVDASPRNTSPRSAR